MIMKIANTLSPIVGSFTKSKPLKKLCNNFYKDPGNTLAWTTVGSIIAKDGLGCAMYVYQSKHNKKIPEDRRRFVTATDLTNGGLMIVTQIASFLAMRKISEPIFNKIFKKLAKPRNIGHYISRFRMEQEKAGEKVSGKLKLEEQIKQYREKGLSIFKFILDLSAATILAKRMVVPFIAIPLASKLEKRMMKNEMAAEGKIEEQTTSQTSSNPTMTTLPATIRPSWFKNN